MKTKQDDLKTVRRIILDGLKGHKAKVFLYGSTAKGEASQGSDIDVAVATLKPLPPGLLSAIREALDESPVPYPVELIDLSLVSPDWAEQIQKQGILWSD
ncbi:MAG: nucleotidyltransferase domain-containing protein [Thermodesulfobacteriota bacterium]|nr:nucleotidyltransferase domain-containing protein [Thermodesulfobacteriota bacterium]